MYIWWCCTVTQSCPILCNPKNCSTLGFPDLAQTHVHWVNDAIQPSHPLSPPPLALNLSRIRVFSNESTLHITWPKYWSFSFSPSNEYSGLISFRTDWFDHLAVQGTLKCPQHHSSKVSFLCHSAFFMVQLSYPYMTTRKIIALSTLTFVSKVMSLLFSMLSSFVIAFIPRSKCLLISRMQSPSEVIFQPKKIVCHCFHCFSIY